MLLFKHREHSSSRGFTIAELGAGMGVFALAAALMAPVAMNAATTSLTGETIFTVADNDGRKPITTPPVDAVEVTVVDANGNNVKTVTVNDPSATSTVISGLDSNATYTFEVAKVNAAGKSAKATAALEYKQTGTRAENYTVTVPYTATESTTVGSTAEQVDDTTKPIYATVIDKGQPIYVNVDEEYSVQEKRTRTKIKRVGYVVEKTRYEPRVRIETVRTNHSHPVYRSQAFTTNHTHYESYSYNHPHTESYSYNHVHTSSYNHVHSSNHTHRSSYNHRHSSSYCHYHSRYYRCHRHTSYSNHTHYSSSNHTHYSNHTHTSSSNHTHSGSSTVNHTHTGTRSVNHPHTEYRDVLFGSENHVHESKNTINYQVPVKYNETAYKDEPYQEDYFVTVTKTRVVPKLMGYGTKKEFRGYQKKTQYRLCYQPRGFGGVKQAQRCEIHSNAASKRLEWQVTKHRNESRTKYLPVYGHAKKAPEVRAPRNYVVFKASTLSKGRIMASGEVAAVGSGVSGVSKGATKSFYRWSGKTFTFQGEQYVQVHNWALQK